MSTCLLMQRPSSADPRRQLPFGLHHSPGSSPGLYPKLVLLSHVSVGWILSGAQSSRPVDSGAQELPMCPFLSTVAVQSADRILSAASDNALRLSRMKPQPHIPFKPLCSRSSLPLSISSAPTPRFLLLPDLLRGFCPCCLSHINTFPPHLILAPPLPQPSPSGLSPDDCKFRDAFLCHPRSFPLSRVSAPAPSALCSGPWFLRHMLVWLSAHVLPDTHLTPTLNWSSEGREFHFSRILTSPGEME